MRIWKKQNSKVLLILIFLFVPPQTVTAKMYKWVDEDGNTHYTQSPPPGGIQAEELSPPPAVNTESAQKKLESRVKKADELQAERYKKAELEEKQKQIAAEKELRCSSAKASQASFERPRVNMVNEDGSRRIMGEEERLAALEKAEAQVKDACQE